MRLRAAKATPAAIQLSVLLLLATCTLFASGTALASQGGHYRGSGSDAGSRASITGSASVPSSGGVIASVRVQSSFASSSGLFQVGHIKQGSSFTTDCGTGTIGYMVERRAVGGSFFCNTFFGSFGSNHLFAARHISGGGWKAYIDGVQYDGPYALSYTSGYAYAVGEFLGGQPTSYLMTFGPSGSTKWQYTIDRANWNVVSSSSIFNDGGWSIGAVPSPFNISR